MNINQPPQTERDFDQKFKWKIFIPVAKGWPQEMTRAFKIKSQYDVWLAENNIKGTSYYNMLYLTHNKDVVYFKLSWPGSQNFTITKLRK
mgnify:FL=1|tara:strand:- start:275 stop:544 length:270 start_codon:yes stop_codon:yes gene_type:complete